ncbi:hypothetical protein OAF54_00695 [bacterium]|nr:hypothetical protein [bacterium]
MDIEDGRKESDILAEKLITCQSEALKTQQATIERQKITIDRLRNRLDKLEGVQ